MSARCEGAFHFSNGYTMAPLLRNPRLRTALSPQLSSSTNNLPVPSPLHSSLGAKAGAYLLLTQSEGLFSDNCAVFYEGGHLFTWADVRVSLPVKISKLAPIIRVESTPFDSSAQVLLVPEPPSGKLVSQALRSPQEPLGQDSLCLDNPLLSLSAATSFLTSPLRERSCLSQNVDTFYQLFAVFQIMQRVK